MSINNNDRIKVVGYAQRVFYDNGIEYRNFSDDLVGNQTTSDEDGTDSIFTFGNFVTRINNSGRSSRLYSNKKFSNFYNLQSLNLNVTSANKLLENNIKTTLNLDDSDLSYFAYFGSATEYVRVSLEKIITNWPAALYLNPLNSKGFQTVFGNTFEDYIYDIITDSSTFKINTNFIINDYNINYKNNGTTLNTFNESNSLRNISNTYESYVVFVNDKEYEIIGFTGSTTNENSFLYVKTTGDPFSGVTNDGKKYHIKPKELLEEEYFNSLNEFENNLLNRLTNPKYSSTYKYKFESENGDIINSKKTLTWPVTDGYNLDFNTPQYINYVNDLLEVTRGKDSVETNLIVRFLTSESITDFDTAPMCDGRVEESFGEKINKTLKIYGREFDEIKKYINSIKFANTVTYDKKNNIPDQLIKYLARTLGWELTSSLMGNDLITNYLKVGTSTYPGYSRGYTPQEAEVELWRRLILNSAHIWKTKGTRNPIEFFFKMIGTPDGLINFNEFIYKVKEPINMDLFYKILDNNNLNSDLEFYNVDSEGYPKFFRDTPTMYFQKGGGWYRETAGSAATQYTLVGNNPHIGPYDSGKEYIAQLENIIPSFSAFTITSTTITSGTTNLFTNYNNGLMNNYVGETYVEAQSTDGADLDGVVLLETTINDDDCPEPELTDCGCDIPDDDDALTIDVTINNQEVVSSINCDDIEVSERPINPETNSFNFTYELVNMDGSIRPTETTYVNPECCTSKAQGFPYLYTRYSEEKRQLSYNDAEQNLKYMLDTDITFTEQNEGYICCISPGITRDIGQKGCGCTLSCNWELTGHKLSEMYSYNENIYLQFYDEEGNKRVVNEADSCFCPRIGLTTPEVITDPYTNKKGYACKLEKLGKHIFNEYEEQPGLNSIYMTFKSRKWGVDVNNKSFGCNDVILTKSNYGE